MSKIIAVTGATGSQGGGVVNIMQKTPGWTVRAITRNPESESSKKLVAAGVEVIQASFDDESSLVKAFEASIQVLSTEIKSQPLGKQQMLIRKRMCTLCLQ